MDRRAREGAAVRKCNFSSKGTTMKRKTIRARRTAAPAVTPARAFQTIRTSAQKAIGAGVQAATGVGQSAYGAFDSLVKQGAAFEAKSRKAALAKATKARHAVCAQAEEAKAKTVDAVNHLEKVFEQRVSRAISRIGVPTTKDVRALTRQVAQLQASVEQLRRSRARAAR
jgi:poly(hydroxyalkanoate) granule-associated protein